MGVALPAYPFSVRYRYITMASFFWVEQLTVIEPQAHLHSRGRFDAVGTFRRDHHPFLSDDYALSLDDFIPEI